MGKYKYMALLALVLIGLGMFGHIAQGHAEIGITARF